MAKHVTVNMNPEDEALIKKLKRILTPTNGALSTTGLFRLALRNLAKDSK